MLPQRLSLPGNGAPEAATTVQPVVKSGLPGE